MSLVVTSAFVISKTPYLPNVLKQNLKFLNVKMASNNLCIKIFPVLVILWWNRSGLFIFNFFFFDCIHSPIYKTDDSLIRG